MSRRIRVALLFLEGISSAAIGAVAVFAPELVFDKITDVAADAGGLTVARQLGSVWVVAGLLACLLTRVDAPKTLRMLLVPLLIGDLLHAAAMWPWNAFSLTHLIPTGIYFLNRGSIALWPDSFVRR